MIKFKPGVLETPRGMRIAAVRAAAVRAASIRALNAKYGVVRVKQLYKQVLEARPEWTHLADNFVLYVPEDQDILKAIEDYKKDPNVISVSRVSRVRAFDTNPNDTYFANQYGLTNIKAPQAWDRTTGESSVLIAVLDTGINYNHEDFQGRVDVAKGWDFVNNDDNPLDDYGHGTSVSGVIGATTNNAKGVAGVDWRAQLVPIKVLNHEGYGDMDDILEGIERAISEGVDVINMSFGQYNSGGNKYVEENPQGLKDKCLEAYQAGIVLVAAAGNDNLDWNTYPAYYSTVLAVAAVDQNDARSIWNLGLASNYGTWIDLSAPGTSIWSTHMNGGYTGSNNGTSLACPFVAGLAGLIKAVNPGLTNQQIMNKIKDTADDIDSLNPGFEGKLGTGRINAYLALRGVVARISSPENNTYITGKANIYGDASGWDFSSYVLEALQGGALVTTIETSSISVESGGLLGTWETSSYDGQHTIRLKVFSVGLSSEESTVTVFVDNITPEVSITSPTDGATVERQISIVGTAEDQYLDHYILEYGEGEAPLSFETIHIGYVSVTAGALGIWETAGLEGIYTIRLTAYDKVDVSASESIKVNIRSEAPTREAEPQSGLPLTYALPNPFNRQSTSEVTFNYTLEGNFDTKIYLFDLSGNLIWQSSYLAGGNGGKSGENNPSWKGRDLFGGNVSNGIYIYQIVADSKVIARGKIIVLN